MKPGRKLPLWSYPAFLGRFFYKHKTMNAFLSLTAIFLLALCLIDQKLIFFTAIFLTFICFIDCWRILYLHYWIISLFGFCFPAWDFTLGLTFGTLYFFAGFFKIFSPDFFRYTAPFGFYYHFLLFSNFLLLFFLLFYYFFIFLFFIYCLYF